ncbi:hypothetical protein Val02_21740 [Virgisporangium aliadipatigenens]|uniref:Carrier domain-containing protein n=1 Tax=Virgisporangium aliadipatigenens TaxID=741659 RepID=A0A8J3YJI7_9ACTN|nr:non-ribosomal peptide synthetase [Virgisporangium aliadipatigenens]GIJ45288.1 hypothetical protein Val02_21740 [Virgisporangium aliadipatigenens]
MTQATPAQHGIWLTERSGDAGTAYHLALTVRLDGPLDEPALRAACAAVLARHEPLRSAVAETNGVAHLVPAPVPPTLARTALDDPLVAEALTRPFDLERGPLARFVLAGEGERHLLLFVAHHLVFDGMSKDILVRELARSYAGATDPAPPPRPHPPAVDPGEARAFWRTRWRDTTEVLLPHLGRPPAGPRPGATVRFTLDAPLSEAIDRGARKLGVTRFELLLTAVHAVLRRYGNTDVPVAVDVSTRTPEVAEHIGLFVNELPIAVAAPEDVTFADLATAVRAELRAAYRFRAVPVAHAVGGMRPRTALAPVSVSYRRRAPQPQFVGVRAEVDWAVFAGTARNALHLQFVDAAEGLDVSLRFAPDSLPVEAAERIAGHLRTFLAAAVREPDVAVRDLLLLPADEEALLLREWNDTRRDYPDTTLPALFRAQARRTPRAAAAVCGDRTVTYAELDAAGGALAARLRARGVGPGALVAICVERSLDLLVALLAVTRGGAGYVPVDPAYPAARRALILDDARPAVVLTTRAHAADLPPGHDVLLLDAPADGPTAAGSCAGPNGDDTAYVLYTSGSTGRPKGVDVPHSRLTNFLLAFRDALAAGPGDTWLALTSPSFDICALELYLPLITGGRVVIVPERDARDPAALVRLVRERGVTHVQATPSGWRVLLDGGFGAAGREPVVAVCGGEALPAPLARTLRARVGRLFHAYGPTETTVWSTLDEIPEPVGEVTIGRPVANTRVYLLDGRQRPVPIGTAGEVCVGGAGVARGYVGRPELTAERFVPDPWAPGGHLYRTGDLARYLPDGRLVFLGRSDSQVKIRGHRVECGEIEARLLEHPRVAQAAVILRDDPDDDGPRLVGYVVPRGDPPTPAALREHLADTLPAAVIPTGWLFPQRFPLTPNGKLDRSALPAPAREPASQAPRATGGDDAVIETIRMVWREVLQLDEVGDDEDLFDLGGHSLSITRMMTRIQQQLGVALPLEVFYDTPTVAEIAVEVRRRKEVHR